MFCKKTWLQSVCRHFERETLNVNASAIAAIIPSDIPTLFHCKHSQELFLVRPIYFVDGINVGVSVKLRYENKLGFCLSLSDISSPGW